MEKIYRYSRIIKIVFAVIFAIILFSVFSKITVQDILKYQPQSMFLAICALLGLFCIKAIVIVIPIVVLLISSGLMFGKLGGLGVAYLGVFIEITISYMVGKHLGSERIKNFEPGKSRTVDMISESKNIDLVCLVTRILPGPLPLDIMSMLFGAFKMNYFKYMLFSLLGLTPGMIPWILAGSAIHNPFSAEFLVPFGVGIVIVGGMFVVLKFIERRKV